MTVPTQIGPDGLALLKSREGYRGKAYKPVPSDPWTLGWGCTYNLDGSPIRADQTCTLAQGVALLDHALLQLEQHTVAVIAGAATTQHQFDAMIVLGHNIGSSALAGSTVLHLHRAGDYPGAAHAFGLFKYSHGVVMPGLIARRAAEAALYLLP